MLNGRACCEPQVAPPSNDAADINACAPPFDQRSCCQTAIWLAALNGSTSVFGKTVPPAAGAAHPATGLGFTDTTEVNAANAAVAAASANTITAANAVEKTSLLKCPPLPYAREDRILRSARPRCHGITWQGPLLQGSGRSRSVFSSAAGW